jgi:soluble lytic murein transglycosylase
LKFSGRQPDNRTGKTFMNAATFRAASIVRTTALLTTCVLGVVGVSPTTGAQTRTSSTFIDDATLWLVPSAGSTDGDPVLAVALAQLADDKAALALPALTKAASDPVIGPYARVHLGRAYLATDRSALAADMADQVLGTRPSTYLADAALRLAADAAEERLDWSKLLSSLRALASLNPSAPEQVHLRIAQLAREMGDLAQAHSAFAKVYYEYPLTPEANAAADALSRLSRSVAPEKASLDLSRAHRLFGARRYADARKAYEPLRAAAEGDDRQLIDLRLAECDVHLKRYPQAREALRAHADRPGPLQSEAQYFYLVTIRELGREDEYLSLVRTFVDTYPDRALAEQTLNELGTYFILKNDDGRAAEVFTEMVRRFPMGTFADRANWKAGWWAYKNGNHAETIRLFETAAVTLRRADYRPSWLYWAARSRAALGDVDAALAGYRQVISDYRNSYYGREAARAIASLSAAESRAVTTKPGPSAGRASGPSAAPATAAAAIALKPGDPPANAAIVRALLTAGLYDDAIGELRTAQREQGTSPLIDATIAYALNRRGELRPAITTMRRAYPQFMAHGGELLPQAILRVIFPLDYWDLIRRHAAARKLDPHLMAALIAQESTFDADIRSVANAWGLMQIIPATGRRYAQLLGIRPFRTDRLTDPETNIRIGMAYFADLLNRFGDPAPALAAYNAGEQRVSRWLAERPGVSRDEFIDDIPFPETQNYVKRIVGTAEDYRQLYR